MSELDDILMTGERRSWVENGLIPKTCRIFERITMLLRDARTYNDLDEVAKFAKNIPREIQECHDNWRLLDGARKS